MADTDSYHEKLAFAVTGAVLGATVEPYDRDGRQRAVDAILHYADGRKAAPEVSATGPDSEVPIQHYLGQRGHSRTIAGVAATWVVQLPRTFHPADDSGFPHGADRDTCNVRHAFIEGQNVGDPTL